MYRWWSMRNEEACTLTVEGEDVLEDVVLDVAEAAAGGGVVGVEQRAAAEGRLELGVAADDLRPHPLHPLLLPGAPLRPRPEQAHQRRRTIGTVVIPRRSAGHHRLKRRHA